MAAITGSEDHSISLADAKKLTKKYRDTMKGMILGGAFGKDFLLKLVQQNDCVGMRYYFAQKDDGSPTIVIVGVDKNGDDMVNGEKGEFSFPCPPYCSISNTELMK